MGGEKAHKQSPPESRDNPVKFLFACFFLMCLFFAHKNRYMSDRRGMLRPSS